MTTTGLGTTGLGSLDAAGIIRLLQLERHPEGGWYRQTFADKVDGARSLSTLIYFLLEQGDRSHWHRVDSAEVWHYYAGAPLELMVGKEAHVLGIDLNAGQRPQAVVPRGVWQSARSLGAFTLVGCTVAPGFEFSRFELAPPGWEP